MTKIAGAVVGAFAGVAAWTVAYVQLVRAQQSCVQSTMPSLPPKIADAKLWTQQMFEWNQKETLVREACRGSVLRATQPGARSLYVGIAAAVLGALAGYSVSRKKAAPNRRSLERRIELALLDGHMIVTFDPSVFPTYTARPWGKAFEVGNRYDGFTYYTTARRAAAAFIRLLGPAAAERALAHTGF